MNVLDLAEELNLSPKRIASTHGGEYKSKCPNCQEGKDRFCIWPNQGTSGRYWCRVCEAKGDALQFCRDFLGMSFHQACKKVNITPHLRSAPQKRKIRGFQPHLSALTHPSWQQAAKRFIDYSHKNLMNEPSIISQLEKRGLTCEAMKRFHLGWNPKSFFDQRQRWGLSIETKENGSPKRQWLPKGTVIPTFAGNDPIKIKIRRDDWFAEDSFPKYVEVSGSRPSPSVYGDPSKPIIIVESELDAILIQQEASHLVCCMALGGVSKKPDVEIHELLQRASLILLSLDFDEAGKKHSSFWMSLYPHLHPWPAPCAKSIGDAFQEFSMSISSWIKAGFSAA